MLVGIMSDVHCNAVAMKHALDEMGDSVDQILLAGDAVLQYRFSNEVIEAIRDNEITYVAGNHELTLLGPHGERARSAAEVRARNVDFMAAAPKRAEIQYAGKRLLMVHASPFAPFSDYLYAGSPHLARCAELDADFLVCAGYKWLLSPFGTGFFWIKSEHLPTVRPGPFYWMAVQGSDNFSKLNFDDPKPAPNAKRWDAPEWASYFNFNLAAMDASVELVSRAGPEHVAAHNRRLVDFMFERLPKDRCIPASPLDAAERGPYGCFAARSREKTTELYQRLRKENVIVSLREGNIRVSPYLYNTERDIDRLISVITP